MSEIVSRTSPAWESLSVCGSHAEVLLRVPLIKKDFLFSCGVISCQLIALSGSASALAVVMLFSGLILACLSKTVL